MSGLDFLVAVAQMRPKPQDVHHNLKKNLRLIEQARTRGAKMVVFPELCVSAYLLGDRWEDKSFIRELENANEVIRKASTDLVVVWGSVKADWDKIGEDGRVRKYNAAFIAQNGEWVSNGVLNGWIPKTNMPEYRFFDDPRHFYSAMKLAAEMDISLEELLRPFLVTIDGRIVRLAVPVCEDLWSDEYHTKPSLIYKKHGVDLVIDISHSPWTSDKWKARDKMLHKRALEVDTPILYVNAVGLQNNAKNLIWFDGGSCLIGADGKMCWMGSLNREKFSCINLAELLKKSKVFKHAESIAESHAATIAAMRDFYRDFKRVVIGLSGGIDSAVSLAMHVEALGEGRVLAVNMPTQFNSKTTVYLAALCAKNFGVEYRSVPIQEQYETRLQLLKQAGYPNPSDFDRQNIQARIRGQVLADISACEASRIGGRCGFTCNGNKTEIALNYFTLYGDGAGCSAFFADYWKGDMYTLARFINGCARRDIIPEGIIGLPPSAELSSTQNVDDGKGDPIFYPFHDNVLKMFIERRWDPTDILALRVDGSLEREFGLLPGEIEKYFPTHTAFVDSLEWAWRQYSYEGKRHMLPSGFIRTRRAFGYDRRETIADGYFTEAYKKLRDEYLRQTP